MDLKTDRIAAGIRFKIRNNSLPRTGWQGWRRCRREPPYYGRYRSVDGAQRPTVLHRDYISLEI